MATKAVCVRHDPATQNMSTVIVAAKLIQLGGVSRSSLATVLTTTATTAATAYTAVCVALSHDVLHIKQQAEEMPAAS